MAKTYGQLPSYVKANATTYDILVTEAVLSWEREQYERAQGKIPIPKLTQEQMQEMINRVKKQKKKSRSGNGRHTKKIETDSGL